MSQPSIYSVSSYASVGDVASLSGNIDVGGANTLILVGFSSRYSTASHSATRNGIPMTLAGTVANGTINQVSIWYAVSASVGTHKIVCKISSESSKTIIFGVLALSNADQIKPLNAFASATGNTSPANVTVPSELNTLVLSVLNEKWASGGRTITPAGTQQWNRTNVNSTSTLGTIAGGSTSNGADISVIMSWTLSALDSWCLAGVSVNPVMVRGVANLSGLGSLSISIGPANIQGAASLSSSSSLVSIGVRKRLGIAALSGFIDLTSTGIRTRLGVSNLSGLGSLTSAGIRTRLGIAPLSGLGSLISVGIRKRLGVVSLSGSGSLSITGLPSAFLIAISSLIASGIRTKLGLSSLTGTGSLISSGFRTRLGIVSLLSNSSQVISGVRTRLGIATLIASNSLVASGIRKRFGAVALVSNSSQTISGNATGSGPVANDPASFPKMAMFRASGTVATIAFMAKFDMVVMAGTATYMDRLNQAVISNPNLVTLAQPYRTDLPRDVAATYGGYGDFTGVVSPYPGIGTIRAYRTSPHDKLLNPDGTIHAFGSVDVLNWQQYGDDDKTAEWSARYRAHWAQVGGLASSTYPNVHGIWGDNDFCHLDNYAFPKSCCANDPQVTGGDPFTSGLNNQVSSLSFDNGHVSHHRKLRTLLPNFLIGGNDLSRMFREGYSGTITDGQKDTGEVAMLEHSKVIETTGDFDSIVPSVRDWIALKSFNGRQRYAFIHVESLSTPQRKRRALAAACIAGCHLWGQVESANGANPPGWDSVIAPNSADSIPEMGQATGFARGWLGQPNSAPVLVPPGRAYRIFLHGNVYYNGQGTSWVMDGNTVPANDALFVVQENPIGPSGSVSLTGTSSLTSAGIRTRQGISALSGLGTLSAVGIRKRLGTTVLSGSGSLVSTGIRKILGVSIISGLGSLTSIGIRTRQGVIALLSSNTLVSVGIRKRLGISSLSGSGNLTTTGIKTIPGIVALSGFGSMIATPLDSKIINLRMLAGIGI